MSTINVTNIKHPSSSNNNIVLASDGSCSFHSASTITASNVVSPTGVNFVDFTNIPSNAKRITIEWFNLDSDGPINIQIGDSGGIETSGYTTQASRIYAGQSSGNSADYFGDSWSTIWGGGNLARNGHIVLTNPTGNSWVGSGLMAISENNNQWYAVIHFAGSKTLSGTLDRVRVADRNGSNFTSGSTRMYYEV